MLLRHKECSPVLGREELDAGDALQAAVQRLEGVALRQQHQQPVQRLEQRRAALRVQQLQPQI